MKEKTKSGRYQNQQVTVEKSVSYNENRRLDTHRAYGNISHSGKKRGTYVKSLSKWMEGTGENGVLKRQLLRRKVML